MYKVKKINGVMIMITDYQRSLIRKSYKISKYNFLNVFNCIFTLSSIYLYYNNNSKIFIFERDNSYCAFP